MTILRNPGAPKTLGVKRTEGYEHNSYEVVTHIYDEDPTMVEYIRADVHEQMLADAMNRFVNVGEAFGIYGAPGFTMAAFREDEVPNGSIVYVFKAPE